MFHITHMGTERLSLFCWSSLSLSRCQTYSLPLSQTLLHPFSLSHTHTCSFKANSLTLPMPFSLSHTLTHSLNHSSAVSQTHFQPLLVFRPLPYILLQQPHACEAFCGCWSSHKHMFSAVAWFISTENKKLILTTL